MSSPVKTLVLVEADSLLTAPVIESDASLVALAEQASATLGYTALTTSLVSTGQVITPDEQMLLGVLREHDVKLYLKSAIAEYKQAEIDRVMKRLFWAQVTALVLWIASISMTIGSYALSFSMNSAIFGWICLGGILLFVFSLFTGRLFPGQIETEWVVSDLSGYAQPVPHDALILAATLKEHASNLTFEVEDFIVNRVHNDPLLFVKLGDARFCTAVWDEPRFNAPLVN